MYLTKIIPNIYRTDCRRDLRDPYDMHRTLCRAFPDPVPGEFLWRLDYRENHVPILLVQSARTPTINAMPDGWVQTASRSLDLTPTLRKCLPGYQFRFRLKAFPAKKMQGRRRGLNSESDQLEWIARQADVHGFRLDHVHISDVQRIVGNKGKHTIQMTGVQYDGILVVTAERQFVQAVRNGIGHGKIVGLGLLSIA